jgi:hypothetical protein
MLDPVLDVVQARELGIVQKVFSAEEFAGQVDTIAQNWHGEPRSPMPGQKLCLTSHYCRTWKDSLNWNARV